jgi:hypothetical protein
MAQRIIPYDSRCVASVYLKDGSGAQCFRRRRAGELCRQHSKMKRIRINAFGAPVFSEARKSKGDQRG